MKKPEDFRSHAVPPKADGRLSVGEGFTLDSEALQLLQR